MVSYFFITKKMLSKQFSYLEGSLPAANSDFGQNCFLVFGVLFGGSGDGFKYNALNELFLKIILVPNVREKAN